MKIKLFKKEINFKKKEFIFNTNLYWRIVLFSTFIILIFSFLFAYRLFTQINQESILPTVNDSGQIPTVNKDRIIKVLNYFSEREKKSVGILNSPVPVVDPSL